MSPFLQNSNIGIVEKQMHTQRVTVWCRFRAGDIIALYFSRNKAGEVMTVNGYSMSRHD